MQRIVWILTASACLLCAPLFAQLHAPPLVPVHPLPSASEAFPNQVRWRGTATLPLIFEAIRGNTERRFDFHATTPGVSLRLYSCGVIISGPVGEAELRFEGGNPAARPETPDLHAAHVSYFRGRDPRRWVRGVPAFPKVRYRSVYPGIDVEWYGRHGRLEFDVIVSPGADPSSITLQVKGTAASIDPGGTLLLSMPKGVLQVHPPLAYQVVGGQHRTVRAIWLRQGENRFRFKLARYDAGQPLVIDPVLVYSSYVGASDSIARAVAVSSLGDLYVAGETTSGVFGTGSLSKAPAGESESFVLRLDPTGSRILYAAYIGGNGADSIMALAVDPAGNVVVAGATDSTDFPAVKAWQSRFGGGVDAFVAKLNPQGTELLFSTYLGGPAAELAYGLALDPGGAAYVTGATNSVTILPASSATVPGYQRTSAGAEDGFACKLDSDGRVVYATLLAAEPATKLTVPQSMAPDNCL